MDTTQGASTKAATMEAYARLIEAIRARVPLDKQLELADTYIAAIVTHGTATGRKLPTPNRHAILRQLS